MAGKVGCALLLAVLFAAAAVSRTSFAVFLAALAVLLVGFLAWYVRTLRRDVTVTLQLPARPVHPDEDFAVLVKLHNNGRRPVPELRVVLQAVDAESGTAIELPCGAMLAPHQCADLRVTLRAAKAVCGGSVCGKPPCATCWGCLPRTAPCRPKAENCVCCPPPRARTTAQAQNRRTAPKK